MPSTRTAPHAPRPLVALLLVALALAVLAEAVRAGAGADPAAPQAAALPEGWDLAAGDADIPAGVGAAGAVTVDALNLRTGPGRTYAVRLVIPRGATVTVEGGGRRKFFPVTYAGVTGWAYGVFLDPGGRRTALALEALRLRAGPSARNGVRAVVPAGARVVLTGGSRGDYVSVAYGGREGWVAYAYLRADLRGIRSSSRPARAADALNLRAGPAFGARVLDVIPRGARLRVTGAARAGFSPVRYGRLSGWAATDYLSFGGGTSGGGDSLVAWPFEPGADWKVTQGYNGRWSHYNSPSNGQYRYSFDLRRVSGFTAGQRVLSPATGTIRWIDRAYGGMSIDLGNGYAVAFFHVELTRGLAPGQRVRRGQYMGVVAEPYRRGAGEAAHIHLNVWRTYDGGNWSRIAVPFTGRLAIAGREFPDRGGPDQWEGTIVRA